MSPLIQLAARAVMPTAFTGFGVAMAHLAPKLHDVMCIII